VERGGVEFCEILSLPKISTQPLDDSQPVLREALGRSNVISGTTCVHSLAPKADGTHSREDYFCTRQRLFEKWLEENTFEGAVHTHVHK
jgi:hypothetical protein